MDGSMELRRAPRCRRKKRKRKRFGLIDLTQTQMQTQTQTKTKTERECSFGAISRFCVFFKKLSRQNLRSLLGF
jgi:hypothetical protein